MILIDQESKKYELDFVLQFTDCQELDEDFQTQHTIEGTSVPKLLERATEFAQKWLNFVKKEDLQQSSMSHSGLENSMASSSNSSFWSNLIQNGIRYKALIALLFYYMETGQKFEATSTMRNYCLKSTSLYFVLLGVPGSGAFKIFHPVLYNKALDTFKMAMKLHLVKSSPKKKSKKGSSKSQGGSLGSQVPRARHYSRSASTCSGISDMMDWDDSDEEDGSLTPAEVNELTNGLNRVLYSFLTMLDHCPLKRSPESLEQTVAELVELTHLETGFANLDFTQRLKRSDLSSLAYNAYVGLQRLCTPLHGQVSNVCKLILQHILPGILMTHRGSSDISPKGLAVIREHTLHFIKHLMVTVSEDTHDAVEILIHHLAMKVPDKAEYRHRASAAINVLMMGLPLGHFSNIVKWFFRLAHVDKSANRQFAIEVMGQLLVQNERENPATQGVQGDHDYGGLVSQPTENGENEQNGHVVNGISEDEDSDDEAPQNAKKQDTGLFSSHKFLFGVIFSRCKDSSALVRAKALQTLAEVTSRAGDNDVVADIISNLFEDSSNSDRNEKGTVDFVELLQDPEADLSKVNPLPKSEELVDFLRKRALDDSVYVRKNALLVLENILRYYSSKTQELEPLALDLVGILTEHCRDPSLMVRKQIVGSLTEIVKAYPDNQIVINKFVEGVFPLILDVEQKAAEKVHECIWEVLFGNIVSFDKAVHTRHFLPWKILNATEKLKMTSYLSRACSQWAKDKMLKPSLLTMLRTHIDTENSNSGNFSFFFVRTERTQNRWEFFPLFMLTQLVFSTSAKLHLKMRFSIFFQHGCF